MSVCRWVCAHFCASMHFCVYLCVRVRVEERRPGVGCCCCIWVFCGSLWSRVDLVGLSSGAQTMPVQDYPPRDKVCDYHEKTASSSLIAKDCQACWRGGPPLISCREMLNAGAHSLPYTHTQGNTMTHTHIVTGMLILIHMCTYSQFVAHVQTYTHKPGLQKLHSY